MKNIALAILLLSGTALAGTSAATATITDTDSQTWNNGSWTATLSSPGGAPTVSGTPVATKFFQGKMNGSGVLSVTLTDTSTIDQSGAKWVFVICPNASSACGTISTTVVGATPSLSTVLSAGIKAPRFNPGQQSYGYLDKEVLGTPVNGAQYYQVTCTCIRSFSAANGWTGSSGGAPSGAAGGDLAGTYPNPTVTTSHINAGTINTATIGATTPAAITGTTVNATTSMNILPATASAALNMTGGNSGDSWELQARTAVSDFLFFDISRGAAPLDINFQSSTVPIVQTMAGGAFGWGADASFPIQSNCQTCLWQNSNLVVSIGNGTPNDANGTLNAAAINLATHPVPTVDTGSPTVGQSVCIKSAGPPIQLGTCTSVVGAGGACTCS